MPAALILDFEAPGTLVVTNYRLAFLAHDRPIRLAVPLALIDKFDRINKREIQATVRLNRRPLKFKADKEDLAEECCRFAALYLSSDFTNRDDFVFCYARHAPAVAPLPPQVRDNLLEVENNIICYEYPEKVYLPLLESSFFLKIIPEFVTESIEMELLRKKLKDTAMWRNNKRFPVVVHARPGDLAWVVRCSHYRKPTSAHRLKDEPCTASIIRVSKKIGVPPVYLHLIE
jgi:hypothetical protein